MSKLKRISLVLLAAILCSSAVACASGTEEQTSANSANDNTNTASTEGTAPPEEEAETEEPDPFADFDYNGQSFRVYTSSNNASDSLVSSNFLIEGPEELTGEAAADAAMERNAAVEELLNIKMEFTQCDLGYLDVNNDIRTYIMAGEDRYDLIINDLFGVTGLTVEGMFHDAAQGEYFDFSKPWWYGGFMDDIALESSRKFMMGGDFFIDVLRTGHCLVYNKNMYADFYGDGDELYEIVLNGGWTLDKMIEIVDGAYLDLDGNGQKNIGDRFGYAGHQDWGPCIPFLISSGVEYVSRDENGYPVLSMNNERTIKMCDLIYKLWNSPGTGALDVFNSDQIEVLNQLTSGNVLILGYQRLGSLEVDAIRSAEHEIGIIPYPKLDEQQENYVTSAHDTSEVGLIPVTAPVSSLSFISAVTEVLSRETHNKVLPLYYENSLKVKYTRDEESAQMIDIIHDGLGNSFALAWHSSINGFLQNVIHASAMTENSFASTYASYEKTMQKTLEKLIESYKSNIGD